MLVKAISKMTPLLIENQPDDKSSFPIGWIATSVKPGARDTSKTYPGAPDFIRDHAKTGDILKIIDGTIVPIA